MRTLKNAAVSLVSLLSSCRWAHHWPALAAVIVVEATFGIWNPSCSISSVFRSWSSCRDLWITVVRWTYWAQSLELYIVDASCSAAVAIDVHVRKPVRIDVSTSRCRAPVALALGLIGLGSKTYKTKIVHVFILFAFFVSCNNISVPTVVVWLLGEPHQSGQHTGKPWRYASS